MQYFFVPDRHVLERKVHGRRGPWTTYSLDNASLGRCVPWTMRLLDVASLTILETLGQTDLQLA
jgi:hypothetical protein